MATKNTDTLSGEPLKDLSGSSAPVDSAEGVEAVKTVAAAKPAKANDVDASTQQNALDWFISSEPIGGADGATTTVRLNVGTEGSPKWIDWKLRAIELDALRSIRKRAANTREARRTGNVDEFRVNLEIVAAATVEPDLRAAAEALQIGDPAEALRQRFYNRPGYITQLAGKVLTASGFDEEDVQDATQVAAAGNS
jgi:hypothetical protein